MRNRSVPYLLWPMAASMAGFMMVLGAMPTTAQDQAPFTRLEKHDQAMIDAIAKAQSTLDAFLTRAAKPQRGDSDFSVKIRYDTGKPDDAEYIWASDPVRQGNNVTATIANEPRDIPDLREGQRVTVPLSRIVDWMYWSGGRIYGGYTMRALLPHIPKVDADKFRKVLAPE